MLSAQSGAVQGRGGIFGIFAGSLLWRIYAKPVERDLDPAAFSLSRITAIKNSPTLCVRLSFVTVKPLPPHRRGFFPTPRGLSRPALTGCGARIGRRPLDGTPPLRPRPLLRLPVSAAGGGRLRSCSRPPMVHQLYFLDYSNKKRALRFP